MTKQNLDQLRRDAAENSFTQYDFVVDVSECSPWDTNSETEFTRMVYTEPRERMNFHVRFAPNSATVTEAVAYCMETGQEIGFMEDVCLTQEAKDSIKQAEANAISGIKLSVPELFADKAFQAWLESSRAMTWHPRGQNEPITADSWSDVAIFVDPSLSGDGTDSDMPGHELIVSKLKEKFGHGPFPGYHFVVILTNV
jgi:hypothetical protein